jgi:O-antigen/teichoic acid export membrane protein
MDKQTEAETLKLGVKSAKVASLVGLTHIVSMIIGAFTLIVLARLMQPAQYGVYTLAYSVSLLFSAFSLSSVGSYLNKYIPLWTARKRKDEIGKDLGTSFMALIATNIVAIAIGIVLSGFIAANVFHSAAYTPLIYLALVGVIFTQLMYLSYNTLIGFRDGVGTAITYSAGNIAIAAGSIALVLMGFGAYGAIAGMVIGTAFGSFVGLYFITRHSKMKFSVDSFGPRARRILGFSLPIAAASMIPFFINNFSILLLGFFSSAAIIGSFGIAYKIGSIATTATGFIGSVLVQMFSSAIESRKAMEKVSKLYNYSIYFGALIAVPIAVYLIVFSHAVVGSLFPAYKSSLLYTPAVTVSLLIGVIGVYATALLMSMGKVMKVIKYSVITGIAQTALLLLLVPLLNVYGLIISVYLAGSLLTNYLYVHYMRNNLKIETMLGGVYRVIAAGAILSVALALITIIPVSETQQLLIGIVATILGYPLFLGLMKAVGKEEMRLIEAIGESTRALRGTVNWLASYISFFARL